MSNQSTTVHEAATLDRLVGNLIERDIDEYVRQYRAGRTSIGPTLIAAGFDPYTGKRLASPATRANTPPRPWSDGRRRRTLDRHVRITSGYQTVNGQVVRPLATLKMPPATKIFAPSTHR